MSRKQLFHVLTIGAAAALLLPLRGPAENEKTPAPLPLRRLLLTPEQLPRQLKRLRDGVLVRLPREEFEARVRRASRPPAPPRLVEARYRAALTDSALVGSAQWKVLHHGPLPALLDLQAGGRPFNLALKQPRWENRDALVAAFDGRGLSLLVDQAGEKTLAVEWSARGEGRPDGLHFDLRFPACPLVSLELDLPADHSADALDGSLVSGPYPAEKADRWLWKVVCGNRRQVRLLIRRARAGVEPLVLAALQTRQALGLDGLEAVYDFDLSALHRGVQELVCECDPVLRPIDVQAPDLRAWDVRPGPRPGAPSLLTIRLGRPLYKAAVRVRCLAPLAAQAPARPDQPVAWSSPALRLTGAVPRGEALELEFHPDLRVVAWNPGAFRTADPASPSTDKEPRLRRLTLVGGGVGAPGLRRPSALVHAAGVEYRARQLAWWQVHAAAMDLTLQIAYDVEHGRLFQLPVRLPSAWDVEAVDLAPAGLLRNWSVRPDGMSRPPGARVLRVDLRRPLRNGSGARPTLSVRLRHTAGGPFLGRPLLFPDAQPLGARFREGALALGFDTQACEAVVATAAVAAEADREGPWGEQAPERCYPYDGEPVAGTLTLWGRPPRLRARCASEVFVASGRVAVETRLLLQADGGSPDSVDLYLSSGGGHEPWRWQPEAPGGRDRAPAGPRVRRVERLVGLESAAAASAGLAARDPLQAAALLAARPPGQRWRLTLERPLRGREVLALHATRKLDPSPTGPPRWEVPLAAVLGATRLEGEVTLHLVGADLVQVEAVGLREGRGRVSDGSWGPAWPRRATPWRTFRYTEPAVGLRLRGRALAAGRTAETVIDQAALTTTVGLGELRHRLEFRLLGWPQRTLPVRLPPGARLVAAGVDRRWVEGLPESADELALPVPAGAGDAAAHHFEVTYTTAAPRLAPWARLQAPLAALPVEPLVLRRRWRLPPGVRPLWDARHQRLPGPGEGVGAPPPAHLPTDIFRLPSSLPASWPQRDDRGERRQALEEAAASLRRGRAGQTLTLAALVEEVAFSYLKEAHPLVVDAAGVREAGLTPDTHLPVRAPASADDHAWPWEARGLVALPARSAVLLTGLAQAERWRAGGDTELPGALEGAIARAAAEGQDPSVRFLDALTWLRRRDAGDPAEAPDMSLPTPGTALAGWIEWEPCAGATDAAAMVVVDRSRVTAGGLTLAVALSLVFWAARRRAGRFYFLLAWLAVAGLGVFWLPAAVQDLAWWPLVAGLLVSLAWLLRRAARRPTAPATPAEGPPSSRRLRLVGGAAAAGAVAGLLALGALGRGADPEPETDIWTVFLLPPSADAPGKQTVLARPALLARLDALARPASAPAGAVLTGAAYDGKIVDGAAEFDVVFQVHGFGDGPQTLALPLGGVRLQGDVLLDGAAAAPVALAAPQAGYALRVAGRGRHKVELRFRAPVAAEGDERAVRFTAPRLAQNRLSLLVPASAARPRALVKNGAQRLTATPAGGRLEVELGAVAGPLHLRWSQPTSPPRPGRVEFREAYLWDLGVEASTLTAFLTYRISERSVDELAIQLPDGLEVRAAEARRPDGAAPASGAVVRCRDWAVAGAGPNRTLRVQLAAPVSGPVEVTLDLVPRAPLPGSVKLPLPRPAGRPAPGVSYLAYRAVGVEAARTNWLGVAFIRPADFAPFWPVSARPLPRVPLTYAVTFLRERPQAPELQLSLRPLPPRARTVQDVAVRVGTRRAEVRADVRLTAWESALAVVEWDLQSPRPLTIAAVTGPDVRRWSQTGPRLLVWLKQPVRKTRLEVTGWVPVAGNKMPGKKGPGFPQSFFDLPCLRPRIGGTLETTVRLQSEPGLALEAGAVRGLTPVAGVRPTDHTLAYAAQPNHGGTFQVLPGTGPAVRILTRADLRQRRLTIRAAVECQPGRGGLHALRIRLSRWDGTATLDAPADRVVRRRETRTGRERTWSLDLKAGRAGAFVATLTGSLPEEQAVGGVEMPHVSVEGAFRAERAVIAGEGLTPEAAGLVPLAPGTRGGWPKTMLAGGGRAFGVAAADWRLRLLPRGRNDEQAASADVLLAEHSQAVADGRRWVHQMVYWLRHEAHTDLNLTWPAPVRVVSVAVDDAEAAPLQPEPARLWLPLPGRAGVHRVRLRWFYVGGAETLEHPSGALPHLEGARGGPSLWTVFVPPGWRTRQAAGLHGAARAAVQELARARVELELSRGLLEGTREAGDGARLAEAQWHFYHACCRAQQALAVGGGAAGAAGPDGASPAAWLAALVRQNRELFTRQPEQEPVRAAAERQARSGGGPAKEEDAARRGVDLDETAPSRGTPVTWQFGAVGPRRVVELEPADSAGTRLAFLVSAQWLGVLLLVWWLSLLPVADRLARRLWPEALALVGVVGWLLAGPTALVLFLLAAGLLGRVLLVGAWLRARLLPGFARD
jgi:hypothetical protein